MPDKDFLRRRNEAWRNLREAKPDTPEFETALRDLQRLIAWPRNRILAGLGWTPDESIQDG
ncbi:hypothetical protein [Deinococcus yavapaiensis]|uniref:Uncharacterized protein n=1 Tax=Deinococcus yavapaiensis KR-236 TaxID=694435 RepID=A0A318SAP9_9DEIO|nr:hypothetical protein [Deinococcus yavapaiensis]PYE53608.1 hypothetical protein DES52_108138 [Deinococcus yavapaiensis KR-236]